VFPPDFLENKEKYFPSPSAEILGDLGEEKLVEVKKILFLLGRRKGMKILVSNEIF